MIKLLSEETEKILKLWTYEKIVKFTDKYLLSSSKNDYFQIDSAVVII